MESRPQVGRADGVDEEHEAFLLLHSLLAHPRWWSRSKAKPGLGRSYLPQRLLGARR